MTQGSGKLGKAPKSKGSQKRKVVRKKTLLSKGRKSFAQTKKMMSHHNNNNNHHSQAEIDTTKAINRRNESVVAAKAVSCGARFFMKDVSEKGTQEMKKQLTERNKKQNKQKASKLSERLEDQLKKISSS